MANTIIELRHSYVTGNVPTSLANGELAINTYDGKLFYRGGASNTVQTIERYEGPAGLDGEIQFNDSGVLGSNSGLLFDTSDGSLQVSGNVVTTQYFIGDGSKLTGLAPTLQIYELANTAADVSGYMVAKSLDAFTIGTQNTTTKTVTTTPTLLTSFITDVGFPNIITIPVGDVRLEFETQKVSGPQSYYSYFELYKRTVAGVETLLLTSDNTSSSALNTLIQQNANIYNASPITLTNTDRLVIKIYAVMTSGSASVSLVFDGTTGSALTIPSPAASIYSFVPYLNATANVYLNSYSLIANTVVANTTLVANTITIGGRDLGGYVNAAFLQANTPSHVANSSALYANAAFLKANTPDHVANSAASYANSAFIRANTPTHVANSAASYANSAFARANNSLDANNGGTVTGTITATSFITSGSYGNILGANTIYANNFVANTGYIQFADGTKQYTANAGSGGGGSSNSFATIANSNTSLIANTSNTRLTIVGESGIAVAMNTAINQITIAAQPGAQGLTVDYGYVSEPTYYGFDYGFLS